jgi:uncharacterized protein
VHQDGLVHVSQLADGFIKNPAEVVKVHQHVVVTVTEVDLPRKRIALSMRANPPLTGGKAAPSGSRGAPSKAPASSPTAVQDWFSEALARSKGQK